MKKGIFFVLASALFFSLGTVFAKFITKNSNIPAIQVTFFRFLAGFLLAAFYMIKSGESFRPNNFKLILGRMFFNTVAVILFFTGVEYTSVTNANMLNMTYPVFVFLLAPFINKENINPQNYLYLILTMFGVYFVVVPDFVSVNLGDIVALCSGLVAGMAIIFLREARKYDSSPVIIFYLMALGTLLNFSLMAPFWVMPEGKLWIYIALSALSGVAGQITITIGYKYIDAAAGSIVSTSRIVIAAFFGVIIFNDQLSENNLGGGFLIFFSLIGVSGGWKLLYNRISLYKK